MATTFRCRKKTNYIYLSHIIFMILLQKCVYLVNVALYDNREFEKGRYDPQHNDTQHKDIQHKDIQHNSKSNAKLSKMTLSIMAVLLN
jgi:hypothetical protein